MEKAASPLDFIKRNLAEPQTQPLDPQKVSDDVLKAKAEVPSVQEPIPTIKKQTEEPKKEELTPEPQKVEEPLDPELADDSNYQENYKKLKTKFKETKASLTQLQTEKETLTTDLEKYKTGEVVPQILRDKEQRIAELEKWEKIHNLKSSKEYTDKYIQPLSAKETQLKAILTDYGIPEESQGEVLTQALNTTNTADLNRFLSSHFDELGASEIKTIVKDIKHLQTEAKNAEAEPARVLSELTQEAQRTAEIKHQTKIQSIEANVRDSWVESLTEIRAEKKVLELIRKDNDPEFNKNFVDPILSQASLEYGKFVTELVDAGIENLPKPLAKVLAKAFLLAHATAVAIPSRNAAMQKVEEVTRNASRVNSLMRPQIGGGVASSAPAAPEVNLNTTVQQDAKALLNSVLSRRQ